MQFFNEVSDTRINDNEVLVSFDAVLLFTAIPVDKACGYIKKNLEDDTSLPSGTNLNINEIVSVLNFTLSNNCFVAFLKLSPLIIKTKIF